MKCDQCGFEAKTEHGLRTHIMRSHRGDRKHAR